MKLVFTGEGKGKTTAAIGQAVRVLGNGSQVAFFQFIKSNSFPTGEDTFFRWLEDWFGDRFFFLKGGMGFVGIMGDSLPFEEHRRSALDTLKKAERVIKSYKYDLVVLDEVNVALKLGLLSVQDVLRILGDAPGYLDFVLTGRGAPEDIIKAADLVTNFEKVKHPFTEGVRARKGIEF